MNADKLMEPFKGEWIETAGEITFLAAGGAGPVCMIRRGPIHGGRFVECHFSNEWTTPLSRYNNGETLKVVGCISAAQNSHQLYLENCDLRDD